jgi:hypothetical protein
MICRLHLRNDPAHNAAVLLLVAAVFWSAAFPAKADDMFAKLPTIARSFGDVVQPYPVALPDGLALSVVLPRPQPNSETFRLPSSTANVRAGTDPFTSLAIPGR